jgi:ClpX C4-type zinc finger protein
MASNVPPPPVIESARVLAYAFVRDIPYQKWGVLYSGDTLIEAVPYLAICTNLGDDIGPLLFHCDDKWQVLGTSCATSVEETKSHAERNYPGVSARWIDVNTTVEDALRYYDSISDTAPCSFCGKRPFEVSGLVEGVAAVICRECVEDFYRGFNDGAEGEKS